MRPYLLLGVAIAAEIVATLSLRASTGLSRIGPAAVSMAGYLLSFWLLATVLTRLNVGPVYAIWSGLGVVGTVAGGVLLFHERARPLTIAGAAIIVLGVIMMNLSGGVKH